MTEKCKTGSRAYGVSAGVGIVAVVITGIFCTLIKPEWIGDAFQDFWTSIFAVGMLLSLWAQIGIETYFHLKHYYKATTLASDYLEIGILILFPVLMLGSAFVAIANTSNYGLHMGATLFYMGLAASLDFAFWRFSKQAGTEYAADYKKFQRCCGQLFWHVDGVVFAVLLAWVCFLIFKDLNPWKFVYHLELSPLSADLKKLRIHNLREPMMAGIIGFQMIVTVFLIAIHVVEWESEPCVGDRSNSAVTNGSSAATQASS